DLPSREELPQAIRAAAQDYRDGAPEELDQLAAAVQLAAESCLAARTTPGEDVNDPFQSALHEIVAATKKSGNDRTRSIHEQAAQLRRAEANAGAQACIAVHRSMRRYLCHARHIRA